MVMGQVETSRICKTADIRSMQNEFKQEFTFMIILKIIFNLPNKSLDFEKANIPNNVPLADPSFQI